MNDKYDPNVPPWKSWSYMLLRKFSRPAIFCGFLADKLRILPIMSSERFMVIRPADALLTMSMYAVYALVMLCGLVWAVITGEYLYFGMIALGVYFILRAYPISPPRNS